MEMKKYTNEELDKILEDIDQKKYQGEINPERVVVGNDKEGLSIPINDGHNRRVFEKEKNGTWEEVPYVGQDPIK